MQENLPYRGSGRLTIPLISDGAGHLIGIGQLDKQYLVRIDAADGDLSAPPTQCSRAHCEPGQAMIDLAFDANHCGACGHACESGHGCRFGVCE